jgi:Tol biopolymer transport system component
LLCCSLFGATFKSYSRQPFSWNNPPGSRIVFSSGLDIYSMNPDGSQIIRLTYADDGQFNLQPAWSPDHTSIAFVSNRDGDVEIYVMKSDGSMVRRLTYNAGEDSQPAWSPDGTKIAFVHGDDPSYAGRVNLLNCETAQVYVMKTDGSGQKKLTGTSNNTDPAWSPDSKQIAFSSDRDGNYEIYRMNADGSSPARLTFNDTEDADPAWSPDGSRIAYGSGYERINYFCGLNGIIQNPLKLDSAINAGAGDIHVLRLDGTSDVALTTTNNNSDPAWSPDGSQLVFASRRDDNFEIYLMNSDGQAQKRLTQNQPGDLSPSWSPHLALTNSRSVTFTASDGN